MGAGPANEIADAVMAMLKDKDKAAEELLKSAAECWQINAGLARVVEKIDEQLALPEEERTLNQMKVLRSMIKSVGRLADASMKCSLINMIYVKDGDFDTAAAMALNRMGRGGEAIRELFRQKMKS